MEADPEHAILMLRDRLSDIGVSCGAHQRAIGVLVEGVDDLAGFDFGDRVGVDRYSEACPGS